MTEILLEFFKINQGVDYRLAIPLIIGYFILFWVIVSVWVYFDAKKRYTRKHLPTLIFALNLIFFIPFFLMYLLFRPDLEDIFTGGMVESNGGLNVPLVNFVGKEGVVMSFQLKVNSEKLTPTEDSEMKIDINFATNDANKELLPVKSEVSTNGVEVITQSNVVVKKDNIIKRFFKKIGSIPGGIKRIFTRKKKEDKSEVKSDAASSTVADNKMVQEMIAKFIDNKQKKKKK